MFSNRFLFFGHSRSSVRSVQLSAKNVDITIGFWNLGAENGCHLCTIVDSGGRSSNLAYNKVQTDTEQRSGCKPSQLKSSRRSLNTCLELWLCLEIWKTCRGNMGAKKQPIPPQPPLSDSCSADAHLKCGKLILSHKQ